ncbi:MAG: ATP-dependent zinc metalloprotease FtsH [Clostridia bacterium]|nr:ATP-dependent zinc metalloprotease FtsH [Clostridia bacterium]
MAALLLGYSYFSSQSTAAARQNRRIEYTELLQLISEEKVQAVSLNGNELKGIVKDSAVPLTSFPAYYDFETTVGSDFLTSVRQLRARQLTQKTGQEVSWSEVPDSELGFTISYVRSDEAPWWVAFLPTVANLALIGVMLWILMRVMNPARNDRAMGFGKVRSNVRQTAASGNQVRFSDVAGMVEEKEALQEMVDFLRTPDTYRSLGARIPKGVLLVGPPGTGKTLLAKAVAGEAGVPFFSISGSDFVEMFVGVGASRVRDLFDQAKKSAPAIVFIDEIDAVGRQRGAGLGGGSDEREQTLNQLLVEMDGFEANQGVIVMAATNRADILDPALMRPGRFDRQVRVNYPDHRSRVEILNIYTKGKPLAEGVDLDNIAKRMPYATGADLENVMNEAAILAAKARAAEITQQMLIEAVYRVQMGPEKRSHQVIEKERRMVAVHESGHAVIGHFLKGCEEVHLVTIVPRGISGGHTLSLPEEEHDSVSRSELLDKICMMLGGHAAEEVILGEVYTGSSSDLEQATRVCRRMITEFGMGESIGTMFLGGGQEIFVGRDFSAKQEYAEKTAEAVDMEIRQMMGEAYTRAKKTIEAHRAQMEALISALLREETVQREDFLRLMGETADSKAVFSLEKVNDPA